MTRIAPPITSTVSWTVLYRFFNGHGRGGSTETLLVSQPGPCALTGPELVGIMLPLHRPDRVRLGDCKGNGAVPLIRPDERTSEQRPSGGQATRGSSACSSQSFDR